MKYYNQSDIIAVTLQKIAKLKNMKVFCNAKPVPKSCDTFVAVEIPSDILTYILYIVLVHIINNHKENF